jgi:phasin family protein
VAAKKTVKATASKSVAVVAKSTRSFKDTIMAKTQTVAEDFTAKVKDAMTEAQDRAKVAFEKSQALAGEAGEFTKGNVEALVASGKVFAAGMQDIGKDYVTEAKSAFETVQADMKELAAVKSPADFFKLQGEILRRNFDAAIATGSKNSEKVVKIAGEAFAPIQNRVSLAIEKVKQAA